MSDNQVSLLLKIQADLAELKALRAEFGGFVQEIGQGNLVLSALGTGISAGIGAGIGVAITKGLGSAIDTIRESISAVSTLSSEIEHATGITGLSGSAYQTFAAVLKAANQDVGSLTPAFSILSKTIGEAGNGSAEAQKKLAAIGLTFNSLKGLAPEEQFEVIARAINRLSDANERDAATAALLGRNYGSLKVLIDALARDGVAGLTAKVSESTGILNDDYTKAINAAGTRSEEAGHRISVALAPVALKLKEMAAHSKEVFADVIAGAKTAEAPKTNAEIGASLAFSETKGKTPEEIQALLSKELQSASYVIDNPNSADMGGISSGEYLNVILARVKAFEDELAAAKEKQKAADEIFVADALKTDEKAFKGFEATFRKKLTLDQEIDQARRKQEGNAAKIDDKEAAQQRAIKFTTEQAAVARELAKTESEVSLIEADRFKTTAEKEAEIQPLLQKENKLITDRIALLSDEAKNNTDLTPAERQQLQDKIDQLQKELNRLNRKQTTTSSLGAGDQISANLVKLREQWGTTSEQIANFTTNTIGSAIDGVSDGIYGMISGTKTWGQVFSQVGSQILQSLIKMGVQILANSVMGTTAQATAATTAVTTNATITASAAPAAAASSIASYGSAAVVGAAAAGVAIGYIIAMLASGGFAEGGRLVGPGTGTSDSIITRVSNDEFILRASAARAIGYDRLDYMNQTGRLPGYASGGLVRAASGQSSVKTTSSSTAPATRSGGTYLVMNDAELRRLIFQHGDFEANVIRIARKYS